MKSYTISSYKDYSKKLIEFQESKTLNTQKVKNEAMPACFPSGLPEICLHYLGGDIDLILDDQKTEWYSSEQTQTPTLFDRNFLDLMHQEAILVATLILRGEETDIAEALRLIKKNPDLLRYHAIVKDPLGRLIKGTPLQIAVMAGDIDLRVHIENKEDHGIAERLILAGNLSENEIAEQLKYIISEKAKKINHQRNQRVLEAIKRFGEAIIESKADFKNYQSYEPLINQFKEDIKPDTKGIITKGYIFDPKIIYDAIKWFESKLDRFGGWLNKKSDVFWVHGIGELEKQLSSRDRQMIRAGTDYLMNRGRLPSRTSNNPDDQFNFFNGLLSQGVYHHLRHYDGRRVHGVYTVVRPRCMYHLLSVVSKLVSNKEASIERLVSHPNSSNESFCRIL